MWDDIVGVNRASEGTVCRVAEDGRRKEWIILALGQFPPPVKYGSWLIHVFCINLKLPLTPTVPFAHTLQMSSKPV